MRAIPTPLLRYLSGLAPCPTSAPATDAALLGRFVRQRDEAAFAVLVARHGPMVLRLCHRVLGHEQDAEDAFQATFLVLARKAGAIRRRNHLAAWLHGAACRLALKARAAQARRRRGEVAAPAPEPPDPQPDPLTRMTARELLTALDEELGRLPEVYRLPLVLCCLEGRTQEEAARQLGWTPGSVRGRLERGRARLHARLARRGLALAAALLALDALHGPAAAGMPAARLAATAQAALRFAAGARSAGEGSPQAITLAEGALKAMLMAKLKTATAVLLVVTCVGMGLGGLAFRMHAAGQEAKPQGGASVGGEAPSEKDGTAKGLKLTLSADKSETWMGPGAAHGALPVKLKLTFTNDSDKPIKLDAYALPYRIKFQCDGPGPDSVKKRLVYKSVAFKPPTEKDYPVLQPGKSWSPSWTPTFPGDIPDGAGISVSYYPRQPGIYKLRMTVYDKYAPHVEGAAEGTKWLESNELELKVREKAPSGKVEPAKGLKLTLSADKTETRMRPDGKNAVPVKLKLMFTNDTTKPIKLNAHVLQWRMGLRCVGPTAESVKASVEYIKRPANFLPPPVAGDSPVLPPGKSWSPSWTRSFPGDIEEGYAKAIDYALRKPGTYKLRVTLYENLIAGAEGEKRTKWLESNELELRVREKEGRKAQSEGIAVEEDEAAAIKALEKLGGSVWSVDRDSPDGWRHAADRRNNVVTFRPGLPEGDLKKAVAHLRRLPNLEALSLNFTWITDAGLASLKELPGLRVLMLKVTRVTDSGLTHLRKMSGLREIDLTLTRVTGKGVADLRKALPKAKVSYSSTDKTSEEAKKLQGTWLEHRTLPGGKDEEGGTLLIVAGNDLSLGLMEAGHFTLSPKSDPKSIDVEFTDCVVGLNTATSRYLGIYRLEGDTLTLCLKGAYRGRAERPTAFSPESAHTYVFKRMKE